MAVLNEYLARMADVIIAHGGTINEFIGDAIFAVYGAPVAHADHAERAATTALAMHAALAQLNAEQAARGLPRFEMGIGLHTGEAVVGNIGSEQRAKYAVVGSAVNVASRVESATVGGQTLLTAATLGALGDAVVVGPPMAVQVKGIAEPLTLHELRGLRGAAAAAPEAAEPEVAVDLAVRCWVIEDKLVRPEAQDGHVRRLGRRELAVALADPIAPLTNLKMELAYPPDGRTSAPLYGKVLGIDPGSGLVRIRLTALEPADEAAIAGLLA
jgi:adenylate cyclase